MVYFGKRKRRVFKYIIICPLVFLAGYIDAIAGGGGLISLPAYMFTGMPVINCIATNKMSSAMGTSVTTYKYARGGFIPWKLALFCIPCAFGGSAIGANIALIISNDAFKIIMLIILPLTALYVLTKKELTPKTEQHSFKVMLLFAVLIAFVIGIYDGFYGPGTGTFLILLLTAIGRMKIEEANGLTKAINISTNISALVIYIINGQVILPLGIIAGCFNIAGNYLGASKFTSGGEKIVKPVMMLVITIFFVKVLGELIGIF